MKLYPYIEKFLTNSSNSCHPSFEIKHLESGKPYLFHALLKGRFSFTLGSNTLYLIHQHVSVHKDQNENNPCLSAYHYTGYFSKAKDEKKPEYQVHVYFDSIDKPILILFSKKEGKKFINTSIDIDSKERLQAYATRVTLPLISACQKAFHLQLKEDINQLTSKVAELPKLAAAEDQGAYTLALMEIIRVCKNITLYYPQGSRYFYQHRLYRSELKAHLESLRKPPQQELKAESSSGDDDIYMETRSLSVERELLSPERMIPLMRPELEKIKISFDSYVDLSRMHLSNGGIYTALVDPMVKLFFRIQEIVVLVEEKQYIASAVDRRELKELQQTVIAHYNTLIEKLMLASEFDSAETLIRGNALQLGYLEIYKFVHMALRTGNSALLNFILTHYDFPIDTVLFDNLNAVQYCFTHQNPASKAACFEVLLQHNANFTVADPQTQHPIAAVISQNCNHPFMQVFNNNMQKAFGNSAFLYKLIQSLEGCKPHNQKEEVKIKEQIALYKDSIAYLRKISCGELRQVSNNQNAVRTCYEAAPEACLQLAQDSEVRALMQEKAFLVSERNLLLTSAEKRQVKRETTNYLERVGALMKSLGPVNPVEIKGRVIAHSKKEILLLKKNIELLKVNKELSGIGGRAKINSRMRQLQNQSLELYQEVMRLQKELQPSVELGEEGANQLAILQKLEQKVSDLEKLKQTVSDLSSSLQELMGFQELMGSLEGLRSLSVFADRGSSPTLSASEVEECTSTPLPAGQ